MAVSIFLKEFCSLHSPVCPLLLPKLMYDHDQPPLTPICTVLVVIRISSHGLSVAPLCPIYGLVCAEAGPWRNACKALLYAEGSHPNTKLADYANQ